MKLEFRWGQREDYDRIALIRMRSYSATLARMAYYSEGIVKDARAKPGDFLIATKNGEDVGTATSMSLQMWMRGARFPCQGVAYVGTIKTQRRAGVPGEPGIASQIMHKLLDRARERGEAITALMPFRASYYEHFGYGNAERRTEWTIPIGLLPKIDFSGFRFFDQSISDQQLIEVRQRECQQGQCDVETSPEGLTFWKNYWNEGIVVVDQPDNSKSLRGYAVIHEVRDELKAIAHVEDWCCDSTESLLRLLGFLGSLRDQYSFARITLPSSMPLNRLLKETQLPHRQVDHPHAVARMFTRMQIRILDHRRVLESFKLESNLTGKASVAIKESEGSITKLSLDFDGPKVSVKDSTDGAVEMTDVIWSSIVSGELRASDALKFGLIRSNDPMKATMLDAFSEGAAPFCQEYF